MPNRILKESICSSDSLEQLADPACEVLFFRLIVSCDDFGRFDGRPAIVRSSCYKLSPDSVTLEEIEARLQRLAAVDLIRLYTVNGRRYLYLPTWDKHQKRRAKYSKYPPPPTPAGNGTQSQTPETIREQVHANAGICQQTQTDASKREQMPAYVPEFEESRNEERETRNKHTVSADAQTDSDPATPQEPKKAKTQSAEYSQDFLAFWNAYPRKVNKRGAYRCWRARLKERLDSGEQITAEMLIRAGRVYAAECSRLGTPQEFIKHASTFLSRDHPFAEYLAPTVPPGEAREPPLDDVPMEEYIRRYLERRRAGQ